MKKQSFLISILLWGMFSAAQNLLPAEWKFRTGDDLKWASVDFNDSTWSMISPEKVWEQQGYRGYDGFAWYRATFVIPSSYRKVARKNGGYLLNLGKVDDVDVTYFNGEMIGQTGELPPHFVTKYTAERSYIIRTGLIRWNKPNTIAVRVYDQTGNGGIYSGPPALTIKGFFDKISITPALSQPDRIIKGSPDFMLPLSIANETKKSISGRLSVKVNNDIGKEINSQFQDVTIEKRKT